MYQTAPWEFKKYFEFTAVKRFLLNYFENTFELRFVPMDGKTSPEYYLMYDRHAQKYLAELRFASKRDPAAAHVGGQVATVYPPETESDRFQLPKIVVHAEHISSENNRPALLDLCALQNFIHELGHVLEIAYSSSNCAGIMDEHKEADTIEFYSCFMENFVFDREFLHKMSAHYQTGKKIPKGMLAGRLKFSELNEIMNYCDHLQGSMKERAIYDNSDSSSLVTALTKIEEEIYGPERNWYSNSLYETTPPIFAAESGMDTLLCNRHSYLLGRLLGKSVFKKFKDGKSLFRPGIGKKLRDEIYTQRYQRSFFTSYCAYTGYTALELAPEEITRMSSSPHRFLDIFNDK